MYSRITTAQSSCYMSPRNRRATSSRIHSAHDSAHRDRHGRLTRHISHAQVRPPLSSAPRPRSARSPAHAPSRSVTVSHAALCRATSHSRRHKSVSREVSTLHTGTRFASRSSESTRACRWEHPHRGAPERLRHCSKPRAPERAKTEPLTDSALLPSHGRLKHCFATSSAKPHSARKCL